MRIDLIELFFSIELPPSVSLLGGLRGRLSDFPHNLSDAQPLLPPSV